MAAAMTVVCGSSFFFAAAADGAIMDSDAAVAVMAATVADADICSFFHFKWGMRKTACPFWLIFSNDSVFGNNTLFRSLLV